MLHVNDVMLVSYLFIEIFPLLRPGVQAAMGRPVQSPGS